MKKMSMVCFSVGIVSSQALTSKLKLIVPLGVLVPERLPLGVIQIEGGLIAP